MPFGIPNPLEAAQAGITEFFRRRQAAPPPPPPKPVTPEASALLPAQPATSAVASDPTGPNTLQGGGAGEGASLQAATPVAVADPAPDDIDGWAAKYSQQYGVDVNLVKAMIDQESARNPRAVSKAGAQGLLQLMPDTARGLGVTDPFNIQQNIEGGVKYFKRLIDMFNGNEDLAIAAYNAGPGAVTKFGGIPPYLETQNHVRKVNEYRRQYAGQADPKTPPANQPRAGDWLQVAMSQMGKPYIWGSGSGAGGRGTNDVDPSTGQPRGFDCSGYVSWVIKQTTGVDIGAYTGTAYQQTKPLAAGTEPVPGDLVFWNMNINDPARQHVALYIGDGKVIQSGGNARNVNIADINQIANPEIRRSQAVYDTLASVSPTGQPTIPSAEAAQVAAAPVDPDPNAPLPGPEETPPPAEVPPVPEPNIVAGVIGDVTQQTLAATQPETEKPGVVTPREPGAPTPAAEETFDPDKERARLRAMGVSDVDIDRMLGFRGGWKMARQRTLSEVFDPPPAITDGERLSDLLGIVALDGGVDPSSLVGSLAGVKIGDLDKPGQKLFDKLWGQFTPNPDIKATDARSAFAGKGDPNKRAILQEWASLNPKLAESLGTLMTFEWTDPRKPRQPTEVGVMNVGEVHPTDWGGAEFVLQLAGIPDEATFNTFLRRLSGVGAAPAAPSFEGDGFGSVIVRVANADQAAQLREGLDAYRARGVPESPVVVGRQFSPYEIYPRLYN